MKRRAFNSAMAASALALSSIAGCARAEASAIRISHGYGILYLPLMVMRDQHLVEMHAQKLGLGDVKTTWLALDGGNVINDAMLAGSLDVAGTGVPGFIILWAKARGIPRSEVIGLGALSTASLWLNTNNPNVKSLKDFTSKDKIAVPGVKASLSAVVLEMAAARTFGMESYAKLDPLTVAMSHPDAVAALLSGNTEITADFTSPPFSYQEAKDPKITRVLNSSDLLGNITLDVVFAPRHFTESNPRLTAAFMAAQEEANAYIAANRKGAAETFLRVSKDTMTLHDVEQILADKDTQFSTVPDGLMDYVTFLDKAGIIKTWPAQWSDMFVPALDVRKGS